MPAGMHQRVHACCSKSASHCGAQLCTRARFSTRAHVTPSAYFRYRHALSRAPSVPQLVYPLWLGRVLHSVPLLLVAAALGLPRRRGALLREAAGGAAAWAAAAAAGTALPAAVGALRAYASGAPAAGAGAPAVEWGDRVVAPWREALARALPQHATCRDPRLPVWSRQHAQQAMLSRPSECRALATRVYTLPVQQGAQPPA